jgi:hypothetical protein
MAQWMLRAITMKNVAARLENGVVLPSAQTLPASMPQ